MLFVNPYFLFGLFAVSIPVIIHLFNFRKFRKIYFTHVRFIREIQIQTQKQSRLKHLIILLLRILAITSLVLAFAQPYIPLSDTGSTAEGQNIVSIYVDNSFSMEAQSSQGQLMDEARVKAAQIAAAYKATDQFQLLTNDFEGIHQRLINREVFGEMLDNTTLSPVVRKISEVYRRQKDLLSLSRNGNPVIYMISDFQKTSTDLEKIAHDTNIRVYLVPLKPNPTPNIYIDSCWFQSPVHQAGSHVKLFVRLRNISDQDYQKVPLTLTLNGRQKAVTSFSLPPQSELIVNLTYNDLEPGTCYGMLEIMDNPVIYDDRFYFAYQITDKIPVLCIYHTHPNVFLGSLLGKDSSMDYRSASERSLDYSSFAHVRLIILEGLPSVSSGLADELRKFTGDGGSLLVIPAPEISAESYASFLRSLNVAPFGGIREVHQKVAKINLSHPVFREVFDYLPENLDLPSVQRWYTIGATSRSGQETLLTLQNGAAFLSVQAFGNGKVYLLASPLDLKSSSFPQHAIFVPTLYKIALLSQPQNRIFYTLGEDEKLETLNFSPGGDLSLKIKKREGDFEFIPQQIRNGAQTGIFFRDQVRDAGHYFLTNGEEELLGLAFNDNRDESDLATWTPEAMKATIDKLGLKNIQIFENENANLTPTIQALNMGVRLWKLFIILALVFLAAEVILLRFWKG